MTDTAMTLAGKERIHYSHLPTNEIIKHMCVNCRPKQDYNVVVIVAVLRSTFFQKFAFIPFQYSSAQIEASQKWPTPSHTSQYVRPLRVHAPHTRKANSKFRGDKSQM